MPKKKNKQQEPEQPPVETPNETRGQELAALVGTACLAPGCQRAPKTRGLCLSCYQCASKLVKDGATTWEALEQAGKCRAPHHGGRGRSAKQQWFLS